MILSFITASLLKHASVQKESGESVRKQGPQGSHESPRLSWVLREQVGARRGKGRVLEGAWKVKDVAGMALKGAGRISKEAGMASNRAGRASEVAAWTSKGLGRHFPESTRAFHHRPLSPMQTLPRNTKNPHTDEAATQKGRCGNGCRLAMFYRNKRPLENFFLTFWRISSYAKTKKTSYNGFDDVAKANLAATGEGQNTNRKRKEQKYRHPSLRDSSAGNLES